MAIQRLLVVGASLTGLHAVEAARSSGFDGRITLIGDESIPPYDRKSLARTCLATAGTPPTPLANTEELSTELGVDLRLNTTAKGIDVKERLVDIGESRVAYDSLVIATGACPRRLPVPEGVAGVTPFWTIEHAELIRAAFEAEARVVVVGAGFVAAEVAAAALSRGLDVHLIGSHGPTQSDSSRGSRELVADLHRAAGVTVVMGVGVVRVCHSQGRVTGVELADGRHLAADLVVTAFGMVPNSTWLRGALALHHDGGVICDATLATSAPGVWAAGDVTHPPIPLFGADAMLQERWSNAAEQGALAGRNAVSAQAPELLDEVPYLWSDLYEHRVQCVGQPSDHEVLIHGTGSPGAMALYRRRNRLVGALTVDRPRDVMGLRRRITDGDAWGEVLFDAHVAAAEEVR